MKSRRRTFASDATVFTNYLVAGRSPMAEALRDKSGKRNRPGGE
jgi:hypothetical protein